MKTILPLLAASFFARSLANAEGCNGLLARTTLNFDQARALVLAKSTSVELEWRVFSGVLGGRRRTIVILGENHSAFPRDMEAAGVAIKHFHKFAVENGSDGVTPVYRVRSKGLAELLMLPDDARIQPQGKRLLHRSPMDLVAAAPDPMLLVNAEQLHRPHWTEEVELVARNGAVLTGSAAVAVVLTVIFGPRMPLLKNRDASILGWIGRDVRWDRDPSPGFVNLGSSHLVNLSREMLTLGFEEVPIPAPRAR